MELARPSAMKYPCLPSRPIVAWCALTSQLAAISGCAPPLQRASDVLRTAPLGSSVAELSHKLGNVVFSVQEASSELYPFWSLYAQFDGMEVAIGAVPAAKASAETDVGTMKYVGHFNINDGNKRVIRWVYTDGLVFDEEHLVNSCDIAVDARALSCQKCSGPPCQQIEQIVRSDRFDTLSYPRAAACAPEIKACVEARYEESVRVRSLLAEYFLRYDKALLDRNLLDVDYSNSDLISVLWAREATHNWRLRESASTLAMRQHIRANAEYFGLTDEQLAMLAANEARLAALQSAAQRE